MEKQEWTNEQKSACRPVVPGRRDPGAGCLLDEHSSDDLLVERLREGDRRAFDIIFNRYANRVYRQVVKLVGNEADAEEVVQDAFMLIYEKAESFRGEAAFSTWVYHVTLNTALSKLRRVKRAKRPDIDFYLPRFTKDGRHLVRPVVDWSGELDRRLIDGEMQAIVRKAIDQLGPVAKVILLSDLYGYSNREIGEALSLSVQAVKAHLHRARLYLRGKLAVELGSSPA